MPGPTRLPDNVRAIRGGRKPTYALPEKPAVTKALTKVPTPPEWLKGVEAIAEFKRLAQEMIDFGTLTTGNTSLLAHYSMLHGTAVQGWNNFTAPVTAGETSAIPRYPPASLIKELRMLGGALGIARVNFGASGPKNTNPFAEHGPKGRA